MWPTLNIRPANGTVIGPVDPVVGLIAAYRDGDDRRAFERVLSLHTRLLNHVVRRFAACSREPYEDLLQVGYVGLIKAVKGYRLDSEAKFSSYAYSMIEGEIKHHLRDAALVKRPRWARSLHARVSEATVRLTAELGRPPVVEEVAREVNIAPGGVSQLMKLFCDTDVISLDADDGFDVSAIKGLRYETFSLPVEERILLEQALGSLPDLQRKVIYLFFYKDLSQTEIGRMLRLPQRKISRIVASATRTMRNRHVADWDTGSGKGSSGMTPEDPAGRARPHPDRSPWAAASAPNGPGASAEATEEPDAPQRGKVQGTPGSMMMGV